MTKALEPESWAALDLILQHCALSGDTEWRAEFAARGRPSPRPLPSDRRMMRHFCIAIAYSQNAQSRQVAKIIRTPAFRSAFAAFDPQALARSRPAEILDRHWPALRPIRFRGKVASLVACAGVLVQIAGHHGSFARYLRSFHIPRRLVTAADLDQFWCAFDLLLADLRARRMPFFRSTISLLQLLLDLDYDSVKPDLIVMRLARRIGLVVGERGDRMFREAARSIQAYAMHRGLRPSQVDLALLAFGGQTSSRVLLGEKFCPPSDPCRNGACRVGRSRLCSAQQLRKVNQNT